MKLAHGLFLLLFVPLFVSLSQASPRFVEHIVTGTLSGAVSLDVVDMDGDGDLDIVSCGQSSSNIGWFEQQPDRSFTSHLVPMGFNGAYSVAVADFNEDGLMDFATASFSDTRADVWLQQNDGTFSNQVLEISYPNAHTVEVADMNEDGHIDLLTMGGGTQPLRLYLNDGSANFTLNVVHEMNYRGQACRPVDFDGDGDLDILSNNFDGGRFHLFRNDGEENFALELIGIRDGAHWIIATDLNDDGELNPVTVAYSEGELAWWQESFGFYNRYTLDDDIAFGVYAEAADFDLDGDMDLVATSESGHMLAWYENDEMEFTRTVLSGSYTFAGEVFPVDFDQDGDIDIVSAAKGRNRVSWWELESINPPTAFDLTTPAGGAHLNTADGITVEWTESVDNDPGAELTYTISLGLVVAPEDTSWVVLDGIVITSQTINQAELWQDVEPGDYDGVVFVEALSQGDAVRCNQVAEVTVTVAASGVDESQSQPDRFALLEVYPNPFNASATVTVELPSAGELTVAVYNLAGQRVTGLVNGQVAAGTHEIAFDGSDLASGIYLVRATVPSQMNTMRKVVLVK